MSQIAHAARMTKSALYYHFEDKDDLFVHVLRADLGRAGETIAELADDDLPLRDLLVRVARLILHEAANDLGRMFDDLKFCAPDRFDKLQVVHPLTALVPAFERAMERGELRSIDPLVGVRLFHALVLGPLKLSLGLPPIDLPDQELAELLTDVFLQGMAIR
jgi:AcrR family transcriptional regulator